MSSVTYKNILCVRADNMGDVIMTTPALRALKETFQCRLTLLTSSAGSVISSYIPFIDETIVVDFPWVKLDSYFNSSSLLQYIQQLKEKQFDAAIIFTVYSQSALPAAMLAVMAEIPERVAFCRENPYNLLTVWLPDKEPYIFIQHQVERDLQLVKAIGAVAENKRMQLQITKNAQNLLQTALSDFNISGNEPYIILHAGVSEEKRKYPLQLWQQIIAQLNIELPVNIFLTGSKGESELNENIIGLRSHKIFNLAGCLSMAELLVFVRYAKLVITVNTVTVHIAAAMQTPVIVLYALTNPQHTPWMVENEVFYFPVKEDMHSKNEVIRYVTENWKHNIKSYPKAADVVQSAKKFLYQSNSLVI